MKSAFHFFAAFLLLVSTTSFAQTAFSLVEDVSALRSFSPRQKFWAAGLTIHGNFHLAPKEAAYFWFSAYTDGKFNNPYVTTAKLGSTLPQTQAFDVSSTWKYRQFSLGWKHYFLGNYYSEYRVNFYGSAGFGLLFPKVVNNFSRQIDTNAYVLPFHPVAGTGNFRRLTLDLGLGAEYSPAANLYFFTDLRTWLPASSTPSPWLHNNNRVPATLILAAGLRILFGNYY